MRDVLAPIRLCCKDSRARVRARVLPPDRKSTRLNSSHPSISYAVFCLKKKTRTEKQQRLEKGMGEQMVHAYRICADTHGDEHVTELRICRICNDALDVVLQQADGCGEHRRGRADEGHKAGDAWRQ